MNLNQAFAIALVVLGVFAASSAQLVDLGLSPAAAKAMVTGAGLLTSIISGVLGVLTSQASQVKAVQAMPGVERVLVNAQANKTLAEIAVDPSNSKVQATAEAAKAVQETAKG